MTDNGRQFRLLKANKSGDPFDWSPEDAIREFLSKIESGEFKPSRIAILFNEDEEGGESESHHYFAANVSTAQFVWMLTFRLHRLSRLSGEE